jgi:hypothetical protein
MCLMGQVEEKNYTGYFSATWAQLKSQAEYLWDTWRYPGRKIFLTITQAVNFFVRVLIKSELRQRKRIERVHDEVRALRMEIRMLRTVPSCTSVSVGGPTFILAAGTAQLNGKPVPQIENGANQLAEPERVEIPKNVPLNHETNTYHI